MMMMMMTTSDEERCLFFFLLYFHPSKRRLYYGREGHIECAATDGNTTTVSLCASLSLNCLNRLFIIIITKQRIEQSLEREGGSR